MKLAKYIEDYKILAEHLEFEQSCHTVKEAAEAVNASTDLFVKNICMIANNNLVVAIVKGEDRASTKRVAKLLNIDRPRIADPDEILAKTGYPCGGTPSFGFDAKFLIDENVMKMDFVYTGGGTTNSLVKIPTKELLNANNGLIGRVRK